MNNKEIFDKIIEEFSTIKLRWGDYCTLFVREDGNYTLIDKSAPFFFNKVIQPALSHHIVSSIMRLLDVSRGQSNVTFKALKKIDPDKLKNLEKKSENLKFWRNKILSHNDMNVMFNPDFVPKIMHKDIDDIIKDMENFVFDIGEKNGFSVYFPIKPFGCAQALLDRLKEAEEMLKIKIQGIHIS